MLQSIIVLSGGLGGERSVSLKSGHAIAAALREDFQVQTLCMDSEALPDGIDPRKHLVFPALHGGFGEDGRLQQLMEDAGIVYCGSGAVASRLCMDKVASKAAALAQGIPVPEGLSFHSDEVPLADELIQHLGSSLILKPANGGSSVGIQFTENRSALGLSLSLLDAGVWIAERRIRGRELTVGVLNGAVQGIVEIFSPNGTYDYAAKYTEGQSQYQYPALLESTIEAQIKHYAATIYQAFDCRDFARIDFLLDDNTVCFLEVNTLPGLTQTSLLPKSAACSGYDFQQLACALVQGAHARFRELYGAE